MLLVLLLTFHVSRGQQGNASFFLNLHFEDSVTLLDPVPIDSALASTEHRLDSGILALNEAIDSTYALIMSPREYHQHAAKLYERFDVNFLQDTGAISRTGGKLKTRVNRLKAEVHRKYAMLDSLLTTNEFFEPDDVKAKLTLSEGISGFQGLLSNHALPGLPGVAFRPANLSVPGYERLQSLGVTDRFNDVSNALKDIEKISARTIPEGGQLEDLNHMRLISTEQAGSIANQSLLNTAEGRTISQDLGSSKGLEEGLEKATELAKEPEKAKEEGIKRVRKKFVDHFAGHEDKITSEIQSMEKLQRKYHSVTDVRYLPKRRTNPEKGKPFIERLILGTGFQVDRNDTKWTSLDIAPYVGYKFSDRFRAGLGGTYRVAVDMTSFEFTRTDKTYGYRTFANYRIFNGLFAHLEAEALKTAIPSWYSHKLKLKDANEALWVPMAYIGIMKSYSLGRRFHGQTYVLYDFLAVSRNIDFNKVTFRFGFEYMLQKRKRPEVESAK